MSPNAKITAEIRLISTFLKEGDYIIDTNSGIGLFALGTWYYSKFELSIIAIESSEIYYEFLAENIVRNGFWGKSLLVTGRTCQLFENSEVNIYEDPMNNTAQYVNATVSIESESPGSSPPPVTLSHIRRELMREECPAVLRIASDSTAAHDMCVLLGAVDLISSCAPVLYLEVPLLAPALWTRLAVAFLQTAVRPAYTLLWHSLSPDGAPQGLLAVPAGRLAAWEPPEFAGFLRQHRSSPNLTVRVVSA